MICSNGRSIFMYHSLPQILIYFFKLYVHDKKVWRPRWWWRFSSKWDRVKAISQHVYGWSTKCNKTSKSLTNTCFYHHNRDLHFFKLASINCFSFLFSTFFFFQNNVRIVSWTKRKCFTFHFSSASSLSPVSSFLAVFFIPLRAKRVEEFIEIRHKKFHSPLYWVPCVSVTL